MNGLLPLVLAAGVAATPPSSCLITHTKLRAIFFDPGSVEIDPNEYEVLEESVRIAIAENYRGEIVTGYCDAGETAAGACPTLAIRRAKAVKGALVKMGLKAKWIETRAGTEVLNPTDQPTIRWVTVYPKLPHDDCAGG